MNETTAAPEVTENEELWVKRTRLEYLTSKLEKLQKKAAKLGSGEITMRVAEETEREAVDPNTGKSYEPKRYDTYVRIEIDGNEPKLNGWRFVATINHDWVEGDNGEAGRPVAMIRKSPFFEGDISEDAFSTEPRCDHCGYKRNRNDTYVVEHEDGRQAQVGSNCLIDFTGYGSPEAVIRYLNILAAMRELVSSSPEEDDGFDGGYWAGGRSDPAWELETFLAASNAAIRQDGFLSRTRARALSMGATADQVVDFFIEPKFKRGRDAGQLKLVVEDVDHRVAAEVIEWLEDLSPTIDEDYLWNLAVIRDVGLVRWKTAGYAASMINAADKARIRKIEFDNQKDSEYVGELKKRQDFEAKLIFTTSFDGYYGPTYLYKFLTAEGNVLVWFASNWQDVKVGETYSFKATPKKHEERDGIKQTMINRAAGFELVAEEEDAS